jgi:hypothetical protein
MQFYNDPSHSSRHLLHQPGPEGPSLGGVVTSDGGGCYIVSSHTPNCMAKVVAVLTTCWRLIRVINEVVSGIEQTRDNA